MNIFIKISVLAGWFFLSAASKAQVHINSQWAWLKGDSISNHKILYGAQRKAANENNLINKGIYSVHAAAGGANKPAGISGNTYWQDSSGNIYLSGGAGFAGSSPREYLNDLWKISGNNIALPSTLLSFSASTVPNEVLLSWQATRQINPAYFHIEHSQDGKNFTTLGLETAVRNGSFSKSYSFTDHKPWAGSNFYRLKIADTDGKFSYSKIVEVSMAVKNNLRIFPNPASNIIYILSNGDKENATVEIFDLNGRKVIEEKIVLNGNISFSVSIKDIPRGTYNLILKKLYTTEQQKFVKQ